VRVDASGRHRMAERRCGSSRCFAQSAVSEGTHNSEQCNSDYGKFTPFQAGEQAGAGATAFLRLGAYALVS